MPIYSYEALKQGKEIVKGEVTASNLKDARDVIRKMGLVPTKINEFNAKNMYFKAVVLSNKVLHFQHTFIPRDERILKTYASWVMVEFTNVVKTQAAQDLFNMAK